MPRMFDPFQFLLVSVAGWRTQHQQQAIEYLRNSGQRQIVFNDDQRRRLAVCAKALSRKVLAEVATLVTPDTLLAWHRKLIVQKCDGHRKRGVGRPRTGQQRETLVVAWRKRTVGGAIVAFKAPCQTWDIT